MGRQTKIEEATKYSEKKIKQRAKKRKRKPRRVEEKYPGPTAESLLCHPIGSLSYTLPWR